MVVGTNMASDIALIGTILTRRFARQSFENAIELGQRLKPDCKRDLADTPIRIWQKVASVLEANSRDVVHKIYAGHLLKFFAQIIRTDTNCFGHSS